MDEKGEASSRNDRGAIGPCAVESHVRLSASSWPFRSLRVVLVFGFGSVIDFQGTSAV